MLTMEPTLLVGPSDWDATRMPKDEFLARATALWKLAPAGSGAIVYGDRAHHAELAYLTGFTPKLEAALALIPRVGAPRLLVGGGANMIPAAKPLTFVDSLQPLRNAGATVAQWGREQSGGGRPVLIGGAFMPPPLHQEITEATGAVADKTSDLWTMMRRKSARELALIRESCATLAAAVDAMGEAQRSGAGATATVLAGEHAAWQHGAQDVRTLFSIDGGRTLRPFEMPVDQTVDPLQVYAAVRRFGYWAEGFAVISTSPDRHAEGAGEVLRYVIDMIRPGKRCGDIGRSVTEAILPFRPHAVSREGHGNGIGLALEEQPRIKADADETLEPGEVVSLRVGISDEHDHAIVSAMIAVNDYGSEVLWSAVEN
jgi:Xaa-Pro aminopeptidase